MFLGKSVLKVCRKFTAEHPSRSAILKKLLCNFTFFNKVTWKTLKAKETPFIQFDTNQFYPLIAAEILEKAIYWTLCSI